MCIHVRLCARSDDVMLEELIHYMILVFASVTSGAFLPFPIVFFIVCWLACWCLVPFCLWISFLDLGIYCWILFAGMYLWSESSPSVGIHHGSALPPLYIGVGSLLALSSYCPSFLLLALGLCLFPLPPPLYPFIPYPMVVLTSKTMFSLLILLPNLKTHVCCLQSEITLIAFLLDPTDPPTQPPSNSVWDVLVVLIFPAPVPKHDVSIPKSSVCRQLGVGLGPDPSPVHSDPMMPVLAPLHNLLIWMNLWPAV